MHRYLPIWSAFTAAVGVSAISWQDLSQVPLISSLYPSGGVSAGVCSASSIETPSLFGAEILSITASHVENHRVPMPAMLAGVETILSVPSFCNVTVTYTHPGWDDTIHATLWLPDEWNGRFAATGGGGLDTGLEDMSLAPVLIKGYAAINTDGGHKSFTPTSSWALKSPGNIDWPLFVDFASRALEDQAILGKAITSSYYGAPLKRSYWVGCSTGGRQGLMAAQKWPDLYDGILAIAPAISFDRLVTSDYWAPIVMRDEGYTPSNCEFEAINAAVIEACDKDDGVQDGILSMPFQCEFDAQSMIGKSFPCDSDGSTHATITAKGIRIAQRIWQGPRSKEGEQIFHGFEKGTPFSGVANTGTHENGTLYAIPFFISFDWIRYWLAKDPDFDPASISADDYVKVSEQSHQEYYSLISTTSTDLSRFQAHGGKMITYHGLADQLIPPNNTVDYYEKVLRENEYTEDFYRLFLAPGVLHCAGGNGHNPDDPIEDLRKWVEEGKAPEYLAATTMDGAAKRPICMWPKVAKWDGKGDINAFGSYMCA